MSTNRSPDNYTVLEVSDYSDELPIPALVRPVGEDTFHFGELIGQADAPNRLIDENPVLRYVDTATGLLIQILGVECDLWVHDPDKIAKYMDSLVERLVEPDDSR